MRKQLLATTALAVAGGLALAAGPAAADKPSLKVSGTFEQNLGVGEAGDGSSQAVYVQDSEVHFTASTKLDNGLMVSGKTEIDADADGAPDEHWVRVSGSFGSVTLGATDSASYEMSYGYMGSVSTGAGTLNLEFDIAKYVPVSNGLAPGGNGLARIPNDAPTVFYMTPRFNGFQLGVSFAQSAGSVNDIVSLGSNYNGSFGDTGVGVGMGYVEGTNDDGTDHSAMGAGIKVSVGGVTTGMGYAQKDMGNGNEMTRMDLGVRYKFGPNSLAFGYYNLEDEMSKVTNAAKFTIARALGPGVTWSLDVLWAEYDDGSNTTDGTGLSTGVALKF